MRHPMILRTVSNTTGRIHFRWLATNTFQLAGRLGYHEKNSADAAFALHAEVERMLDALIRSLKAKISAKP